MDGAHIGLIKDFTGISSPYEEPEAPELTVDTNLLDVDQSVEAVIGLLRERGIIGSNDMQS